MSGSRIGDSSNGKRVEPPGDDDTAGDELSDAKKLKHALSRLTFFGIPIKWMLLPVLVFVGWLLPRSCDAPNHTLRDIYVGPYVQHVTETEATVIWWTDFTRSHFPDRVEYGPDFQWTAPADETDLRQLAWGNYKHEARLTGLTPDTWVDYRVVTFDGVCRHVSYPHRFRTAPGRDAKRMRFAYLSDAQNKTMEHVERTRRLFSLIMRRQPGLILFGGDVVDLGSSTDILRDQGWMHFFRKTVVNDAIQVGEDVAGRVPIYMVMGNHDINYNGTPGNGYHGGGKLLSVPRFQEFCANPDNGSEDFHARERYYGFSHGPCRFIMLDANNTDTTAFTAEEEPDPYLRNLDNHDAIPDGMPAAWGYGRYDKRFEEDPAHTEQFNWMIRELRKGQAEAAFTIVCFHPSPYSRGTHAGPEPASSEGGRNYQRGYQLRALDPIFRRYGVDLVLTGHDHMVQRSLTGPEGFHRDKDTPEAWNREENLNYICGGNGGYDCRDVVEGWETWMDILGNDGPPYYTVYFYDWIKQNEYVSYLDVEIQRIDGSADEYEASLKVIRTDSFGREVTEHDPFTLTRRLPGGGG